MIPSLEVVNIAPAEAFTVWAHGYPYRTVRWHFHPEYEIHFVTESSGHYYVGDNIGQFAPNNLVMTGPNLPHNWVSDIPAGATIVRRCIIVQFTQRFIDSCLVTFPEVSNFRTLLDESRRGILFSSDCAAIVRDLMIELLDSTGVRRVFLFLQIMEALLQETHRSQLASVGYLPDPSAYMSVGMNRALAYVRENLAGELDEKMLADVAGFSVGGFSRAFKRNTGMTFSRFVNRLRIYTACQLLMGEQKSVMEICYQVGFNNVSNFNRQFFVQKGMSPSKFRTLSENKATTFAA